MSPRTLCSALGALPIFLAVAVAQMDPSSQPTVAPPVSYAAVNQVTQMVSQLEQSSRSIQDDLSKMKVDRWKADGNTKRQTQANVESIQRNLQSALPEMLGQLRSSPDSLAATFKIYRNLAALYDVFSSVAESAGAFGSKDDFQSLQNDLSSLDQSRRAFGERMESIAGSKDAEIARLRAQVQQLQAVANPPAPPKKVMVDATEPPKTPAAKKTPRAPAMPANGTTPKSTTSTTQTTPKSQP